MSFIRLLQASASIALMLGLGCSSTPLRSPPGASLELNTQWLKDYKLARNLEGVENEKSCSLYKRLAEDQRFPAHQLSEVRAWAICAKDLRPDLKPETLPPWLKELSQDIALDIAVRDGNKSAELELTTERSKRRLPQASNSSQCSACASMRPCGPSAR